MMEVRIIAMSLLVVMTMQIRLEGADFVVNSVLDAVDAYPGDGVCSNDLGDCTLRAAVMEANALLGDDTIQLPAGRYVLSILPESIGAATASLDISDDLSIEGAGTDLTIIDGNLLNRVLYACCDSNVQISGVTIQNGIARRGAGVYNNRGTMTLTTCRIQDNVAIEQYQGAGIHNVGILTLINTVVTRNDAERAGGGISNADTLRLIDATVTENEAGLAGGGIVNWGVLILSGSTVTGNKASLGGGIYNLSGGAEVHDVASMTLNGSTISTNIADWGGGIYSADPLDINTLSNTTVSGNVAAGAGGGIMNFGNLRLTGSTVAGNGGGTGGGIRSISAPVEMKNSIIANSFLGGDCSGTGFISLGYNLDSDNSCNLSEVTDLSDLDPLIEPLADNGGPAKTHALLPASPALDAIPASECADPDGNPVTSGQRGVPRPQGSACDIGSYELISGPPTITSVWPSVAPPGERLTVTGTGFFFGAEAFLGEDDGINVEIIDYATLRVTVPVLPTGPVDLTVITATGSATLPGGSSGFTVGERQDIIGMIVDDAMDSVTVFRQSTTTTMAGTVPVGPGYVGDCVVTKDRHLGFVTDAQSRLWAVDLTASPPALAGASSPISISNLGEDLSLSSDQRFLVVCDGAATSPISVVDIAEQTEVSTFFLGSDCNSVDVCSDGSVLVTSWKEGVVRRLTLDGSGALTDTGEVLSVDGPMNVYCVPGGNSGLVVTWDPGRILSFSIPGLTWVDERFLSEGYGISGAFSPGGERVFIRSNQTPLLFGASGPGAADAFEYDPISADLGDAPVFTVPIGSTFPFFGMDQMALEPEGSLLYVSEPGVVNVYQSDSGEYVESITDPSIIDPTGICLP